MGDISIIEFIVYAVIGYSGVVLLVISAFRDVPTSKSLSIVRAMWLIPSILSIWILAGSGLNFYLDSGSTVTTLVYNSTGTLLTNATETTSPSSIVLQNSIWTLFHSMLGTVLSVYVILQMLILFTKKE